MLGGTERMVLEIANQLCTTHNIHLALRVKQPYTHHQLGIHQDVKLYNIIEESFSDWSKVKNLLKINWKSILQIANYIIRHNIDVIYAHDASVSIGALLKLLTGKRLVWHNHNGEMLNFDPAKVKRYGKYTFNTDAVISINKELTQFCKLNFTSIDTYTTISNFLPSKSNKNTGIEIKYDTAYFNVVHVGNFREVKNQLFLIEAWHQWCDKYPNSLLTFFGNVLEHEYFELIQKRIQELELGNKIRIYHDIEIAPQILQGADVGVLCSKHEGFGLVLLEYAQAGLPVLTVDIPACMDIINSGEAGNYYEQNNTVDLIRKLTDIKMNEADAIMKTEKLKKKLLLNYSDNAIIEQINNIVMYG